MCCDFPIACYLKLLTLSALCKSFVSSFNGQFKRFYIFTRWDYLLLPKFNPSRWCSNLSWYFNLSIYERKCLTWQISTSPVVDTTLRLSGLHSFKSKVQWSHLWLSSWGFFPYSPLLQAILLFLHQMVSTCLYWIFISLICSCCLSYLHRELQVAQQYCSSRASQCQDHYSHIDDNEVSVFYYFKAITFTFFIGWFMDYSPAEGLTSHILLLSDSVVRNLNTL